jgi:SAM-dependent methyltransferase
LGLSVDTTSFLDIGTGNGHFLFRLREGREVDSEDDDDDEDGEDEVKEEGIGGFRGRIMGTDYSQKSVEFATQLAAQKGYEPGTPLAVEFQYFDVLNSPSGELLSGGQAGGWDMVLDKGTFDAISLSAEVDGQGRRIVEGYRDGVVPLIAEGGCFLVTSCNWIEEELRQWFEGPYRDARGAGKLEYVGRVPYRSFSFGGKKGQTISTVCFRKVVDQWNS